MFSNALVPTMLGTSIINGDFQIQYIFKGAIQQVKQPKSKAF